MCSSSRPAATEQRGADWAYRCCRGRRRRQSTSARLPPARRSPPPFVMLFRAHGHSVVAVGGEGVEVDGEPAIAAGIDSFAVNDGVQGQVHDTGLAVGVGVDKPAAGKKPRRPLTVNVAARRGVFSLGGLFALPLAFDTPPGWRRPPPAPASSA